MKNKKGSILAYSLLILAIMFAIIASVSAVSVLEKKSAGLSESSAQAFQVADNGARVAIKQINSIVNSSSGNTLDSAFTSSGGFTCTDSSQGAFVEGKIESDKPYVITFKDLNGVLLTSCSSLAKDVSIIKSVGSYKNTSRAVDVKVVMEDPCAGLVAPIIDSSGNKYGFVAGADKKCWLDRNLGAVSYPAVITGPKDPNGYGWYFQWGRGVDGHQILSSGLTTGPVSTSTPGDSFVKTDSSTIRIWYNGSIPNPDSLWNGTTNAYGVNNNPCPTGWHVPTGGISGELAKYMNTTGLVANCNSDCFNKLFNTKNLLNSGPGLQLTAAGFRSYNDGLLPSSNGTLGAVGFYWTSNYVQGSEYAGMQNFANTYVNPASVGPRGVGAPIRCIRN